MLFCWSICARYAEVTFLIRCRDVDEQRKHPGATPKQTFFYKKSDTGGNKFQLTYT